MRLPTPWRRRWRRLRGAFSPSRRPPKPRHQTPAKPNILVIFGDDVGQTNISAYSARPGRLQDAEHRPHRQGRHDVHRLLRGEQLHGGPLVLHHRPDAASAPACRRSASRARRSACRTATSRSRRRSSRSATRPASSARTTWATATNSCRPTHGFDEFFGNLYHLNAEEEPERPYWPKDDTGFVKANSPRGVLQTSADGKIEDTGPLNRKRMETIDDETTGGGDRLHEAAGAGQQAVLHLDELRRACTSSRMCASRCRARAACPATNTPTA